MSGPHQPIVLEDLLERIGLAGLDPRDVRMINAALRMVAFQMKGIGPFICGQGGKKDDNGLPEILFVCPAYGLDGFASYRLEQPYTQPGW